MNNTKHNSKEIKIGIEETHKALEQIAIVSQKQSKREENLTQLILSFTIYILHKNLN